MVKKIFLFVCLFSLFFTVPAMAASSKAKLLTDTSSSANTVPFINAGPAEDSTAATGLGVQVNGTEMMRVTATGSVGIGTTTPARKLEINNAMKFTNASSDANDGVIGAATYAAGLNVVGINTDGTNRKIAYWGALQQQDSNSNYFRGAVGIGTTTPSYNLQVVGSFHADGGDFSLWDGGVVDSTAVRLFSTAGNLYLQNGSGGATLFRNKAGGVNAIFLDNGNVGIGTTSPGYKLHVAGLSGVHAIYGSTPDAAGGGGVIGQMLSNGAWGALGYAGSGVYCGGGTCGGINAWANYSDFRLKKDIEPLPKRLGLHTIMRLRPISFNWINQSDATRKKHQIGLIAQEVEPIVPEVVTTADDKMKTKSIAYASLVPVLIMGMQELKAENDALRARLDALEARGR